MLFLGTTPLSYLRLSPVVLSHGYTAEINTQVVIETSWLSWDFTAKGIAKLLYTRQQYIVQNLHCTILDQDTTLDQHYKFKMTLTRGYTGLIQVIFVYTSTFKYSRHVYLSI